MVSCDTSPRSATFCAFPAKAFSTLIEVHGEVYFQSNPWLGNFESLRNFRCHGGVVSNNPSSDCQI